MHFLIFIIILLFSELSVAQKAPNPHKKNMVLDNTDVENLNKISSESKDEYSKKKNEAIKWAKKHVFFVNKKMSDGRYVSLTEIKNGRPMYLSTYGIKKRINAEMDSISMKRIAKQNKFPLDTVFSDGSTLELKTIKNGKPIYIFKEDE